MSLHTEHNTLFCRYSAPDRRDKKFALDRVSFAYLEGIRAKKQWNTGKITLDQGSEPACVGYAWAHWLYSAPVRQFLEPLGIYTVAQLMDEWEGEDYGGTSVRAGAKLLNKLGFIDSYRWTWSTATLAKTILESGPVVVGTNWYADMMAPTSDNNYMLSVSGSLLGGHAWLVCGVDANKAIFTMKNSWGDDWAKNGKAYISFKDMSTLLSQDGECCIGIEARPAAS